MIFHASLRPQRSSNDDGNFCGKSVYCRRYLQGCGTFCNSQKFTGTNQKKFSPVRYKSDLLRVAEYSGVGLPGLVSDYPFRARFMMDH